MYQPKFNILSISTRNERTDSGKRDIFAHIFKIELLAPQGRVSSQL